MKKKTTTMIIAAAMIFCFTACQATPNQDVVVQKDDDRMIEKAESGENTTLSSLNIPPHYTNTWEAVDGKLHIEADADVNVPDTDTMPIVKVSMDLFTQQQVSDIFNYVFPDEKPMHMEQQIDTKETVRQQILSLKKMLSDEDFSNMSKEEIETQIATLEEYYNEVPESAPDVGVSDGTLQNGFGDTSYASLSVTDGKYQFVASTAITLADVASQGTTSNISYQSTSANRIYTDQPGCRWQLGSPDMPKEAMEKLTITYEEAERLCNEFLHSAGIEENFKVKNIKVVNNYHDSKESSFDYTYQLEYARAVNNIPLFVTSMAVGNDDEKYSFGWPYETLIFQVDNEGIALVEWKNPIKVGETVTQTASLKPFNEIMASFSNMMTSVYGGIIKTHFNNDIELDINIEDIELNLIRIREKNGGASEGLLVPAYSFYGNNKGIKDGEERYLPGGNAIVSMLNQVESGGSASEGGVTFSLWDNLGIKEKRENELLLVVNAIDGSIIDPAKGY